MEIDPIPRGIIFSLLGFPGGQKSKKSEILTKNQKKTSELPQLPSLLSADAGAIRVVVWNSPPDPEDPTEAVKRGKCFFL